MLKFRINLNKNNKMKTTLLSALCLATMLVNAQEEKTIELGTGDATKDVFYNLSEGATESDAMANNWDLAFEISGWTASIRVNSAHGTSVWKSDIPAGDWETFSNDNMASWEALHDSPTSWNEGALNRDASGDTNLGWGTYDFITHVVSGTHIYLIQLQDETYKKLLIEKLQSGVYYFTYADLDGSNEMSETIAKEDYENKNFAYFSLANNEALDREPLTADWDMVFGKYIDMVQDTPYPVTGVRTNSNIDVAEAAGVDTETAVFIDYQMSSDNISTIGYDWKSFNGMGYDIADDLCYFVKDKAQNVYKIVFTDYSGSSLGTISFTQELVGNTVSIDENSSISPELMVYPNPAQGQDITVLYEWKENQNDIVEMSLRNLSGKMVWRQEVSGSTGFYQQIVPTANLASGMYLLELNSSAGLSHQKVVVQ